MDANELVCSNKEFDSSACSMRWLVARPALTNQRTEHCFGTQHHAKTNTFVGVHWSCLNVGLGIEIFKVFKSFTNGPDINRSLLQMPTKKSICREVPEMTEEYFWIFPLSRLYIPKSFIRGTTFAIIYSRMHNIMIIFQFAERSCMYSTQSRSVLELLPSNTGYRETSEGSTLMHKFNITLFNESAHYVIYAE